MEIGLIISLNLSVYIYIFSFLSLIILFLSYTYLEYIQTFNDIKLFFLCKYRKLLFFFTFSSFLGTPPFIGFFLKFFLFWIILNLKYYWLSITLILLNIYLLVFYLQQIRYLQNNTKNNIWTQKIFFKKNSYLSVLLYFQFINIFAFYFIPLFFELFLLYI